MIQSPDRGLTRTLELESSAYAALRHMIIIQCCSTSTKGSQNRTRTTMATFDRVVAAQPAARRSSAAQTVAMVVAALVLMAVATRVVSPAAV